MAWGRGRAPWWAVAASGVTGALVATAVLLVFGGQSLVQAAAAEQSTAPAAVKERPAAPPAVEERPVVTFVGDSWTVGEGATGLRGYAVLTGEQLDWQYHVLGVGGSGYTRPGAGSTFGQRVDRAVDTDADVIVVQGSLNERRGAPGALAPAALATLRHLRAEADPDTEVLVVGASYSPGTPDATIDWINGDIRDAAVQVGFRFVNPAVENWTDPDDPTIWNDPNHPNDAGHQLIADRMSSLLQATVQH
jgi:lysophospholipase L1-like esterase